MKNKIENVKFDYSKLRGLIKEIFEYEKDFVKAINEAGLTMSSGAFSSKINNKSSFTQIEILVICKVLGIPISNSEKYFFCIKI